MLNFRLAGVLLAFAVVLAAGSAQAVEVPSLYTAQVALDTQARDPRGNAYADALRVVLLRVSGAALANDTDLIEALFPRPASYVVQFRPGEEDRLWVSFDGAAIEAVLQRAGQTVWGGDRPLTLLWLAVDWGQGKREIIAADDAEQPAAAARSIDRNRLLRERVLEIARNRGLPVVFPLMDLEDRQQVSFSDIWGGFDEPLQLASRRYDVTSVLVGRIRPGSGQRNRWTYYFGDEQRSFTGEPETVLSEVGDLLASRFAIRGDERLEWVDVRIGGVDSVDAYAAVEQILADINVVETASVVEVRGDEIHYRVQAHGGSRRLGPALVFSGLIEQEPERLDLPLTPVNDAVLEFFYAE